MVAVDEFSKDVGVKCLGVFLHNDIEKHFRMENENNFTVPMVRNFFE